MRGNRQGPRTPANGADHQIDQLVYELYALADEEIRIVEEATGK